MQALEAFARFARGPTYQKLAARYEFNPDQFAGYRGSYELPSGETLIQAQKLWKEEKDSGIPIAAIFLADVSGSMSGGQTAMYDGIAVSLKLLIEKKQADPNLRLMLFVLSDGLTNNRHRYSHLRDIISG